MLSPSSSPPRTTLDDSAIPTKKNPDLFILIPPATPPQSKRSNYNGTVSAPVTPRRVAPPALASARTPAFNSSSKRVPAQQDAKRTQKSPASSAAQDAKRTQGNAHAQEAAALKAAAASQAILRKQKSFTAKTESLKEVIKKNRRMIRKEGGSHDEVSVEIVLPKHMEHLLKTTQVYPDLEQNDNVDEDTEENNANTEEEQEASTSENLELPAQEGNGEDESIIEENDIVKEREEEAEDTSKTEDVNNEEKEKQEENNSQENSIAESPRVCFYIISQSK